MGPGRLLAQSGLLPLGADRNWAVFVLSNSRDRLISVSSFVGRSCWRWHLGPGVDGDIPLDPEHLRLSRELRDPQSRGLDCWLSRERCNDTPMDCQAPVALWLIGNEGLDFVSSATMAEN